MTTEGKTMYKIGDWRKAPEPKVTHLVEVHYGQHSYTECFDTYEKALWFAEIADRMGCRVYV
jgi:hypothetical protein